MNYGSGKNWVSFGSGFLFLARVAQQGSRVRVDDEACALHEAGQKPQYLVLPEEI
jgi:hypothetical protein